jgi:hypothetical protein
VKSLWSKPLHKYPRPIMGYINRFLPGAITPECKTV